MKLPEQDVREMIRIVGDAASTPGGPPPMRQKLLERLADFVSADVWIWALGSHPDKDSRQAYATPPLLAGLEGNRLASYIAAVAHPNSAQATRRFYARALEKGGQTTMLNTEMDPDDHANRDDLGELWRGTGLDSTILSGRFIDEGTISIVTLCRNRGREPFSEREIKIAHIILEEVGFLHEMGWSNDHGPELLKLTPRQNEALNLLLDKRGRKQIAADMGVSLNTVQGYLRDVFRIFDVHSTVELHEKFRRESFDSSP